MDPKGAGLLTGPLLAMSMAGRFGAIATEEAFMRIRNASVLALAGVLVVGLQASSTAADAGDPRRPACTITGTDGDDRLNGTSGADVICGKGGSDQIDGRQGDDIIFAGPGQSDLVKGSGGDDTIRGGAGWDIALGGPGRDVVRGGPGRDDVRGGVGLDRLFGGIGSDLCLNATDGRPGDRVNGGPGTDHADRDAGDRLVAVEVVAPFVCFGG
jgi:Ca2+-binding RTX toxin-like protein